MNRSTTTRLGALAAATVLTITMAAAPAGAHAVPFGGSSMSGQAAQGGGAQTAGFLDWLFCGRQGKSAPC